MAERVGFEPTVHCCITSFQDWLLKPLGHLSFRIQLYYYSINSEICQGLNEKKSEKIGNHTNTLQKEFTSCLSKAAGNMDSNA